MTKSKASQALFARKDLIFRVDRSVDQALSATARAMFASLPAALLRKTPDGRQRLELLVAAGCFVTPLIGPAGGADIAQV